jgi:hypothetical protein
MPPKPPYRRRSSCGDAFGVRPDEMFAVMFAVPFFEQFFFLISDT